MTAKYRHIFVHKIKNSALIRGKGEAVPVLSYVRRPENVSRTGGVASRILNLDTRWWSMSSFTPPEKSPLSIGQEDR